MDKQMSMDARVRLRAFDWLREQMARVGEVLPRPLPAQGFEFGSYGRWAFAELRDIYQIEADFEEKLASELDRVLVEVAGV